MPMITSVETQAKHPATIATQKLKIIKMSTNSTGFGTGNLHESADYPLSAPAYAGLLQEAITYAPEDISAVTWSSALEPVRQDIEIGKIIKLRP
ncbi:hypothetical protein N7499_013135 [Penicillium canescens]|uniref:Uncharacterized protein n=1 Tax=Penicillium canescens TaxID=5083 RepID=A0AAD6I4Z4_PENCN|nr:uncharacterized protein N7446_000215 [Penicillium canescens]KAJ6030721.1 hypothetical protein N7460_010987 [Penicillium canescens]KAJ6059565.1 hypothetical protein N7444_003204 [Penicillium canescens]KAJ6064455.1 hypothetical protein N7499_013135 [Penicillium canescens]KAJ6077279.1 hypothetical protein N7446_000215 [Penicillium canescens]